MEEERQGQATAEIQQPAAAAATGRWQPSGGDLPHLGVPIGEDSQARPGAEVLLVGAIGVRVWPCLLQLGPLSLRLGRLGRLSCCHRHDWSRVMWDATKYKERGVRAGLFERRRLRLAAAERGRRQAITCNARLWQASQARYELMSLVCSVPSMLPERLCQFCNLMGAPKRCLQPTVSRLVAVHERSLSLQARDSAPAALHSFPTT